MPKRGDKELACTASKARGAALVLLVFIIGLAVTALLIKSFSAASLQAERAENTMRALSQAKQALIGWAVSHSTTPGQLPWPDRREITSPIYDGQSDCSSANFNLLNSISEPNFLGQIPTIDSTTPCLGYSGAGNLFQDSSGNNLWYAISRNLVRKYATPAENPIINPGMMDIPTYPWMVVRNSSGTIISDRVAVVILAPGPPILGQERSAIAPPPTEFLDQINLGGTLYSNADYDNDNEDFVMGDVTSETFNDKLVYITIDELMEALTKRAAAEARAVLITYRSANGRFPDASPIAAPLGTGNYIAVPGSDNGTIPVDVTDTATCNYGSLLNSATCNIAFSLLGSVSLQRSGISTQWNTTTESCSITTTSNFNDTCRCTGNGSCSTGSDSFTCSAGGTCIMNVPLLSSGKYIYTPPSYATFPATAMTGSCSVSGVKVECDGDGSFGIHGLNMPAWFTDNSWQDYFYYHKRMAADLEVGARTNVEALIIGTSNPITNMPYAVSKPAMPQTRLSTSTINDYLDSAENTDLDLIFDATSIHRSSNYNDQTFIVAP